MAFLKLAMRSVAALALVSTAAAAQTTPSPSPPRRLAGGFPLFGDAAAAVINATDPTLAVTTMNTKGSGENIGLLEHGKVDLGLVAGVPAYEALAGVGRPATPLKIVSADLFQPGHVRGQGRQPGAHGRRSRGPADRLGHAVIGPDPYGALHHDGSASTATPILRRRFLERAGEAGAGYGRRGGGAVGRGHRLAGLHQADARRRALHRLHGRGHASASLPAQFSQADAVPAGSE